MRSYQTFLFQFVNVTTLQKALNARTFRPIKNQTSRELSDSLPTRPTETPHTKFVTPTVVPAPNRI